MMKYLRWSILLIILSVPTFLSSVVMAEGNTEKESYLTLGNIFQRSVSVDGDTDNFRAMHWMSSDGWAFGFKDLELKHKMSEKTTFEWEASATPADNDVDTKFELDRNDTGSIHAHYKSFRKYYDGTGGIFYPFTRSDGLNESNQDLHMDMGHFALEMSPKLSGDNDLRILYERHTKDGRKSRLSWSGIKDGVISRKTSATWQDVDEVADIVTLKEKTQLAGFTVHGEQSYETVHTDLLREETTLSNTSATASDKKIRRQYQEPDSYMIASAFKGEKWFLDDKNYLSMGYRFTNLNVSEDESISEFTAAGVPVSYTYPENKFQAISDNSLDSHAWIGNFQSTLTPKLTFVSKFKAELLNRTGDSTYPFDSTNPPDGVANTTEVSRVENKINRTGENFSLRYSGLPKTSVYAEAEFEQNRNWITEERNSLAGQSVSNSAEAWYRETLTNSQKNEWVLGSRTVPSKYYNITTQFKHQVKNSDYDDIIESPTSGAAKSAFFDNLRMETNEASTRLTIKPMAKLQSSLRYQYGNTKYFPRAENQVETESDILSQTYTYDVTYQATEKVLMTTSFSRQNSKVSTPAGSIIYGASGSSIIGNSLDTPGFRSDVNTGLVSLSYIPKENISFYTSLLHSWANNFDDFSAEGLPYGADFQRTDFDLGIKWSPKKSWTVEPRYAYYHYDGNSQIDSGDYDSHVMWLDFNYEWF